MFWNAFIWGLGVSSGGAIGLIGFVLTLWACQWVTGKAAMVARLKDFDERSLAALLERNELTTETNAALCDIAASLVPPVDE